VPQEFLERYLIPLPPLEEQRRIVARIEELMGRVREARRLREEAKNDAERLWQAILAQTFPRPGSELPEGWRWAKLGDVSEHRTGIWGPEASDPTQGFPIIRSTEIEGFLIRPQTASVRMVRRDQVDAYKLETGDILINKSSGSPHLVGWPAIFEDPRDGKTYLFSNFMLRLRVDRRALEPWFLLYYLHSPIARSIYLGAQDTTSGLRNLQVREFMAQPIPLPPLEEQRRIVAHLQEVQEKIKALKEAQEQTEAELKRLEQAILEKAFRGEL
jgi:type I restriction enzyme S subunit